MKPLHAPGEPLGKNAFVIDPPDYVCSAVLAANTPQSIAVPSNARHVIFSATANFFARYDGGAAAVPGNVVNGTAAELNPSARNVNGVPLISIVSPTEGCIVTIAFYG